MSESILVVYHQPDTAKLLKALITKNTGYAVDTTTNLLEVPTMLKERSFDLVITGLKMPRKGGLELLEDIKGIDEDIPVIIITAHGTIESAVEALHKGAYDYITKPFGDERILMSIDRAIKCVRFQKENIYLRKTLKDTDTDECRKCLQLQRENIYLGKTHIIGSSTIMQDIYRRIERVAKTSATILITGESGTGKELVARAIHAHSLRSDKNFIAVNCSAIPESLIESELFGHLKGSFTGAIRNKKGLIEEAHGGTLFLDEIGDLNLLMQTKLLRLLQEGEFKAVGDTKTKKADIRFIAATNQDLIEKIERREFRDDLYYRLNVIRITLPLLRERKDDIPVLACYFLRKYSKINKKEIKGFSGKAMEMLINRDWPGNVRELENIIERGVILSSGDTLDVEDLFPDISVADSQKAYATDIFSKPFKEAKERLISDFHARYIKEALSKYGGNVSKAARACGLKREYFHRLMRHAHINSTSYKKGLYRNQ